MTRIQRRDFLRQAGTAAIGLPVWWLTGCGAAGGSDDGVQAAEELAKSLPLVKPGDPQYDALRILYNTRFDATAPAAIARCKSVGDVEAAIAFAKKNALELVARSGGHSFAGYSSTPGLVIDVRPMASIKIDTTAQTATVGAGAALIDVYAALTGKGFAIPAGSCPSVGIAGHALGGGYGLASRKLGTVSDNVLEVQIVTAAGKALVCNDIQHSDLYFACRGGGGGNFGVVTSLKLQIHPVSDVAYFILEWDWADAETAFDAWQALAPSAPDELTAIFKFATRTGGPFVRAIGQYFGTTADLTTLLAPLLAAGTVTKNIIASDTYMNVTMMWAGCTGTLAACHLPSASPPGTLGRETFRAKSDYVTTAIPSAGIQTIIKAVEARQKAKLQSGGIQMDAYGGAIAAVADNATAFVHRDPLFHCEYSGHERANASSTEAAANINWLSDFYAAMRPYVSGFAYQNYIDPDLATWQDAYYGKNFKKLVAVKAKYDPTDLFHFAQSIPTK